MGRKPDPPRRRNDTPVGPTGVGHALELPPWDAPTVLRQLGTGMHVDLAAGAREFRVGNAPIPDVDVSLTDPTVRAHHATLVRVHESFTVIATGASGDTYACDPRAPTGFSVNARFLVNIGDRFALGEVPLMALDQRLAALVPVLARYAGARSHGTVDEALEAIVRCQPLGLELGADEAVAPLAEAIRAASSRRGYPLTFVRRAPTTSATIDQVCRAGGCGLIVVELRPGRPLGRAFVEALGSRRYHLWPLVVRRVGPEVRVPDAGFEVELNPHWVRRAPH